MKISRKKIKKNQNFKKKLKKSKFQEKNKKKSKFQEKNKKKSKKFSLENFKKKYKFVFN